MCGHGCSDLTCSGFGNCSRSFHCNREGNEMEMERKREDGEEGDGEGEGKEKETT